MAKKNSYGNYQQRVTPSKKTIKRNTVVRKDPSSRSTGSGSGTTPKKARELNIVQLFIIMAVLIAVVGIMLYIKPLF